MRKKRAFVREEKAMLMAVLAWFPALVDWTLERNWRVLGGGDGGGGGDAGGAGED